MNVAWPWSGKRPGGTARAGAKDPHASHTAMTDPVDPSYWPRSIGLRVVIAATYFVLVPAGLLPMSTTWWLISAGGLLFYSFVVYSVFMRWPEKKWIHTALCPYLDAIFITLAIIAVSDTNYPIWIGYFLVIMSLSTFHSTRYVLAYSFFAIAMFWVGIFIGHRFGGAPFNARIDIVASIMAVFTALNCDVISTSSRKLREMVHDASMTDPLTGLQNRRRFREVLDSHAPGDSRPLAVIMYDIDNFKNINETMGHVHADGVLVRIGAELRHCFREADSVARYGGDEMIVLAHVDAPEDAVALAQRSLDYIRTRVGTNLSAGVAVYPLTTDSLEDAVRAADQALGSAKRTGKARVTLAPMRPAA